MIPMGKVFSTNGTHTLSNNKQGNPHLQIWLQIGPSVMFQGTTKCMGNTVSKDGKVDVQHWCHFHTLLKGHCSIHSVCVPPIDETWMCNDPQGFIVGDHTNGSDIEFLIDCQKQGWWWSTLFALSEHDTVGWKSEEACFGNQSEIQCQIHWCGHQQ